MASPNGLFVQVLGLDKASDYFKTLAEGAASIASMRLVAGSWLPYARGIETGTHRAAGPARMLQGGLEATSAQIPGLILKMIDHGTAAGKDTTDAIRRTLLGNIQRRTPVRTGRLRDSFIVRGLR